ncbi:MAG: hypothetical protein GY820_46070 [Gammaproteobacteria bacterium]|nr:hypothetical protein [Gammaproteobacteria bacterium]
MVLSQDTELAPGEVVIGQLKGLSTSGEPLVDFYQNGANKPIPAMSTLALNGEHIGRQVALLFTRGELSNPLIIGLIHSPLMEMIDGFDFSATESGQTETPDAVSAEKINDLPANASVDGKRVVFEGSEEVVLKCGEASITLTKAGKIMIRGKYILNRSSGVNRILGGSVQVN